MGEDRAAGGGSIGGVAEAKVKLLVVVELILDGTKGTGIVGIEKHLSVGGGMGVGREQSSDRTGENRDGEVEEEPLLVVDVALWAVVRVG